METLFSLFLKMKVVMSISINGIRLSIYST